MVRPQALLEAVSANLREFLQPIGQNLNKPQKKFLRNGLVPPWRTPWPVRRGGPDRRTKFLSRLDRIKANLNRQSDIDEKLKAALPDLWLPLVRDETPIILDLSDIAKPSARKMDYVWNQGSLVMLDHLGNYQRRHTSGPEAEALRSLRQYVGNRIAMTDYPTFRQKGYDCGSGPTESFCGTLTKRLKGRGMRWDLDNAESIMALGSLYYSELWEDYWAVQTAA